jgi:hypothetical protein
MKRAKKAKKPKKPNNPPGRKPRELVAIEQLLAVSVSMADDLRWMRRALNAEIEEKAETAAKESTETGEWTRQFIDSDGLLCPFCNSTDVKVSAGDICDDNKEHSMYRHARCHACNKLFVQVFKLVGWK